MEVDIKNFIETNIPELKDRTYPLFTTDLSGISLVYKFTPITGGHVKQSQLELRAIHKDYDTCKELEDKLNSILDMDPDAPYFVCGDTRFHSSLAGGGCLFNDGCQMFEDTLYFMIDWRKINNARSKNE